ncbi:3-hydroxyacyl-ACP dehydratase FabZ family protein [Cytobacillus kochii]|uniref:3-hydroxyacyl-ACP dehydratase FabZ family protein n=1 Tax=Cytobacillus kochii TaxID=859143 RepID=UPI00203BDCE8|nr:3-hydroxyacyl-ACP dehydratase FabZ family protein [Cytobacillus kochii]MCM3322435.1 beta-hydroxyacyl-ACP dehydratase [Cytobacillus kochii]MCM3345087.1 beta-hydroxyacyl-ACP dehydratase [Cytobacillus kochii]
MESLSYLPHKYPFLYVDRVVEREPMMWVKGYKNISYNEWFISESQKSMPSTLIIEAIGQIGAFVRVEKSEKYEILAGINGAQIHGSAYPGDRLDLYFEVTRIRNGLMKGKGIASVNGSVIVSIEEITTVYL